jgi:DNA-binding beta-propeller fold protein YncE
VTTDSAAIPGRLDHLAYDPATGRLFIAALAQGSVEVLELNKGERTSRIEGLKKPQGIAVVGSAGSVVVACGDENAVHVYALADLAERAVTLVGQNADNVRSDGTNRVYIGVGPDEGPGRLAVYDVAALKKVGEIPLASRPESFQFDLRPGSNRIFVNLPGQKRANNDGSVALVDRATGKTLATWPLAGAARNLPMAFDADHARVFVAGRKPPQLICLDSRTGAVISRAPCVADSDDLFYDAVTSCVMVIGGGHRAGEPAPPGMPMPGADAALDVFQVDGGGNLSKTASVSTSPHARTGFFAPDRRAIYVVCPPHGTQDAKVLEFTLGN